MLRLININNLHYNNCSQADASTAFLRAARAGQIEKIISLLEQGVDINVSNAVSIIIFVEVCLM